MVPLEAVSQREPCKGDLADGGWPWAVMADAVTGVDAARAQGHTGRDHRDLGQGTNPRGDSASNAGVSGELQLQLQLQHKTAGHTSGGAVVGRGDGAKGGALSGA